MSEAEWAELWGGVAEPAWRAVLETAGPAPGSRVLDVGCGAGHFLAYAITRGLRAAGADPSATMVALARTRAADVREAGAERLPWADASFKLVTSFNAVQFAGDTDDAIAEMARVTVPGGRIAVVTWAEAAHNDLDAIERALNDGGSAPDGDLRTAEGLTGLLADGGLTPVADGLVAVPWEPADGASLVRGILLGEEPELDPVVLAAAAPFRRPDGSYRLLNHFRYAVGERPAL